MSHLYIPDQKKFDKKVAVFQKAANDSIQVVSDFDRTLTLSFFNGQRSCNSITIVQTDGILGKAYIEESQKLFDYYYPIESSAQFDANYKYVKMTEWWDKSFQVLMKHGMTKQALLDAVAKEAIHFRQGVADFVEITDSYKIPVTIFSAGLGDAIQLLLDSQNLTRKNQHLIANFLEFDSFGSMIGYSKPVIHSCNKGFTSVIGNHVFQKIKARKNVVLFGDLVEDVKMVEGLDCQQLLKVGFLNEQLEQLMSAYEKHFDVVILGDGTFEGANKILKRIFA